MKAQLNIFAYLLQFVYLFISQFKYMRAVGLKH
jgi:hypothetical protein